MPGLKHILIGIGAVFTLLVALLILGEFFGASGPEARSKSISVGNHIVTIKGPYKDLLQESMADGIMIAVDGHKIAVDGEQLTVDGNTQVLEPGQNVEIVVDEKGAVHVKVLDPG
jgi:hypothetical protein